MLPNEEIPIQIRWPAHMRPQEAHITIPPELKVVELLNVGSWERNEQQIDVNEFRKSSKDAEFGFFGIILVSPIINQTKKAYPIVVELIYESGTVERIEGQIRVFRPMLELVDAPKLIELTDENAGKAEIRLDLCYSGFGEIQIKPEAIIDQMVVTERRSFMTELLKQLGQSLQEPVIDDEEEIDTTKEIMSFGLNPETQAQLFEEILRAFYEEPGLLGEIITLLQTPKSDKNFRQIIYEQIPTLALSVLEDFLRQHLTERVSLEVPSTVIVVSSTITLTSMTVRVHYRDLRRLEYPPVEVTIPIHDKRSTKIPVFSLTIPIHFGRVEEDPLLNVLEMDLND